jgi:hypothetical protein
MSTSLSRKERSNGKADGAFLTQCPPSQC